MSHSTGQLISQVGVDQLEDDGCSINTGDGNKFYKDWAREETWTEAGICTIKYVPAACTGLASKGRAERIFRGAGMFRHRNPVCPHDRKDSVDI